MTGELRPAGGRAPGVPADLSTLEPGTHLIALYQGDAEIARVAAVFVGGMAAASAAQDRAGRPMTGNLRPICPRGRARQDATSGHEFRVERCSAQHPLPTMCMHGSGVADLMGRGHLVTDMGVV